MKFKRINYETLNPRQKENYNFQRISGILAKHGFSTIRLSDDWNGTDFIALHVDGISILRVQLKTRVYFRKSYTKKNLWICFREGDDMYFFPHDEVLKQFLDSGRVMHGSESWDKGGYSFPNIARWMKPLLKIYRINENEAGDELKVSG